jgi:translation initiation factor 3 subunit C
MTTEMWRSTSQSIHTLFNILEINPEISIDESYEEIDDVDGEPDANVDYNKIQGSIVSFIEQLDDEFTKSLQNLDPHATEYIERLADETPLVTIIIRAQRYFESKKQNNNITRTVIRRIEHTYYKPDHVITAVEKLVYENLSKQSETKIVAPEITPEELVRDLCVFLYKNAEPLLRTRAMLCHIYSVALHGHYYDARDMLLMSHLQETIHQADVTTQVLFNRTMVQIGLSAFKEGLIRESLGCLQELHNTGRVKELLAQGTSNVRHGQNPDQDKLDRQRQIPFHMHINCELVECVFLTCSMLLEVPAMAAAGTNPEAKKRVISKPFRRLLDYSDRQIFHGPPENTRDHIMAASHALAAGEWERSRDFMWDIKIWNLLPEPEKIKAMLASKIQEEALRTYLFTYAPYYSTISMSQLGQMFELPSTRVYSLISKLIWSEELNAGLDQVRNMVVLHAKDPSVIQRLALNLADKTSSLVEGNEKIFELKVSDPSAHLSWSKNTRRTQPNRAKN